jgi:hypothetical protein
VLTGDQIRRLRFARLLVHQAVDHVRVDYDARTAACVTSLQDAVEVVLLIVAEKLGAKVAPRTDFDKYFVLINEKLAPVDLPLQSQLMRLNKMRVQAKHSGIFPTHAQVADMVPVVSAFMAEVCQKHLDADWATANLGALIEDLEWRAFVQEAEKALGERDFVGALIAARKALYLAFEDSYDISRFASGEPLGLLGSYGCEAPSWAKSKQYIDQNVGDPFAFIVIDHQELESKLVRLGIDHVVFWNIWRISPAVFRFKNGNWAVKRELDKVERSDHEIDTTYVVENVADMLLRLEAERRRQKVLPKSSYWRLQVRAGGKLFAKADEGSALRHTFQEGNSVQVSAETFGLDGRDGWWEVTWIGDDNYLRGYIREEDVDRTQV